MDRPRVGFVGAGRMGRPMIDRLVAAGHDVTVHARSEVTRAELSAAGITVAADLAAMAAGSDVVVVCVFDDEQLASVADVVAAALPTGGVLVSHVTGGVGTLEDVTRRHPGVGVVAAPMSGTPVDIAAGRLTVILGGEPADCESARSIVSAYADPIIEAGTRRAALSVKLVNNLLMAVNVQLLVEAVALAGALGLPEEPLLAALAHMSGGSRASEHALRYGSTEALLEGVAPFVRKDAAACFTQARELGVEPGLLGEVLARGGRFV